MPTRRTRGQAAEQARDEGDRTGLLHTVALLVFPLLPLSIQAIAVPALSKAWKQWSQEEQRAKERALEAAKRVQYKTKFLQWSSYVNVEVPLWAAQQHPGLTLEQRRGLVVRAVAHGDVSAAEWFRVGRASSKVGRSRYFHESLCASAARGGHLEALQWLRDRGCQWDSWTCAAEAARGGHLAVLQWARASGCAWDARACEAAARSGHLAVLQWLRANGCDWDASTCSVAARGGHLAVLQWARANGCDWDASTCSVAARGGHLAVLQWARANGCDWNAFTYRMVQASGNAAMLEWARANGCPETWVMMSACGFVLSARAQSNQLLSKSVVCLFVFLSYAFQNLLVLRKKGDARCNPGTNDAEQLLQMRLP
jgi:hypothetical protein